MDRQDYTAQQSIRLFTMTEEHACSYLPDKMANSAFVDPSNPPNWEQYVALSKLGFRRSGSHFYRPNCPACNECKSCRIVCDEFDFSKKRFKRILNKAKTLTFQLEPAHFNAEHYDVYERYINARHHDGDMYPASIEQYSNFLLSELPYSHLFTMRDDQGQVIAATCVDYLDDGISAIYTYFDPDYSDMSLGTLAVLKLCELALEQNLAYVYLGYWVKNSPKMAYKRQFDPLEIFNGTIWQPISHEN
ncbi:arginyltransferase [Bermanella sp. R86510]|uniref:arginyltransferase n=1 Tax=unclassified Bermanella TaxID=2627862 RepID=UPI0037C54D94